MTSQLSAGGPPLQSIITCPMYELLFRFICFTVGRSTNEIEVPKNTSGTKDGERRDGKFNRGAATSAFTDAIARHRIRNHHHPAHCSNGYLRSGEQYRPRP